ncbi:Permease of the drug/metabolite transporter (DMT) superfamily [hydrothermal vent metagenome]|uniref:Permease of the drug/metabolite transporter (DMT) superfamily n=1 Tax=hydrothermal vent metagenome TaxID=652676 RepID=A0A3B1CB76_9ZZZZ
MSGEKTKIVIGYILISSIWGSTWVVIKIGLDTMPPMFAVGLRFFIASMVLWAIIKIKNIELLTDPHSFKLYLFMSVFSYILPFSLVYWAEQFIPSGLTSVLFAIFPFWVIIFSRVAFPNEKIGMYKFLGVLLGFIGIAVIFKDSLSFDFSSATLAILAVVASAIMQGGVAVVIKKHGGKINPVSINFIPLLITGVFLIPVSLIFEDTTRLRISYDALFSILYLSTVGTVVVFSIYYWLMKKINVVILSLSSFITPIIAIILGWFFLNEKLNVNHIIGSSLVLIGILFANFKGLLNYYKEVNRIRNV